MNFGYIRVSSRDQNEERQLIAMHEAGIDDAHIFMDKQSGKDFDRPQYKRLRKKLKKGDTLFVKSMLCALPGTGKDTWIRTHCTDLPVLSLDTIRQERRIKPTDDQGKVIQEAKQRARTMLADHQPFVFSGTNITDMMRSKWAQLFEQYHASVRMVYLETSWQENLRRNAARATVVPEEVIDELLGKMTPPETKEARAVEWKTV